MQQNVYHDEWPRLGYGDEEKGLKRGKRREAIAKALAEAIRSFATRYDARRGVEEVGASRY